MNILYYKYEYKEKAVAAEPEDPRKAMLAMMAKRAGGVRGEAATAPTEAPARPKLKDDPKHGKYLKMCKASHYIRI